MKIQVVSRAVGLLESQGKVIKLMSKSCPLHLLLCGRYCSFHKSLRKVRFNLEEKIVRTFSKIPLAMVYNVLEPCNIYSFVRLHHDQLVFRLAFFVFFFYYQKRAEFWSLFNPRKTITLKIMSLSP